METLLTIWGMIVLIWDKAWWIIGPITLWFLIGRPLVAEMEENAEKREEQRENIEQIKNTAQYILYELKKLNAKKTKK